MDDIGSQSAMTADERSALRSYLQRSEVRLSTIHRTATALLSGAGVLVLIPSVGRDSIVSVLRALLSQSKSPMHLTLGALVVLMLVLALVVVWLLLQELTRFYFHANHIAGTRGSTFTPRFTLTSLHLPTDELGEAARQELLVRRADPGNVELLVPSNDESRRRIDAQIAAYEGLPSVVPGTDASRAEALLLLAGVKDRSLVDEVAKVEYGMARHVLRVQVIVLRYIKALLVVLVTMLAAFVMAAVVESDQAVGVGSQHWLVGVLALWCPTVLFVSSAPVRWLGRLLTAEGAQSSGIRYDRELTRLERIASMVSLLTLVATAVCVVVLLTRPASGLARSALTVALVAACGSEAWILLRSRTRQR
jgi:hypothetical protein